VRQCHWWQSPTHRSKLGYSQFHMQKTNNISVSFRNNNSSTLHTIKVTKIVRQ
jgi:hypothetical protein